MEGVFKGWIPGKTFGYISPVDMSPDVFVHQSIVESREQLERGSIVKFDTEQKEKGRVAINVITLALPPGFCRTQGVVKFWQDRGFGFVVPHDGRQDIFVSRDALPESESGYLCEGDIVDLVTKEGPKNDIAVSVSVIGWNRPIDRLAGFADMGAPGWVEKLSALAEEEPWEYTTSPASESFPILRSYLRNTFRRLEEMDGGIGVAVNGQFATFNTGLVTPNQDEIYAFFKKNPRINRQSWVLLGFRNSGDRDLVDNFGSTLPPPANYYDDYNVLVFDRRCALQININHVIEHIERFPPYLRNNEHVVRQLLKNAEATIIKRVLRNYKTAIPEFYRDKVGAGGSVHLLLPLCLESPAHADLALVVMKNKAGDAYRGTTVLNLDMAYNNARLIARPDTEWLKP